MSISVKRVYDPVDPQDGLRVLVDRLWPRGLSKEDAQIDVWMKSLAPSNELRRWYRHDRQKWSEFRQRYLAELQANDDRLEELLDLAGRQDVVLLYAARDTECNNAVVLSEHVERVLSDRT